MRPWRRAVVALCVVAAVTAGGGWWVPVANAASLVLRSAGGRAGTNLTLERSDDDSDELYVDANELARALHLERFWKPETRKLVLKVGDRRLQVTVDTRVVMDGDQESLLHVPVHYREGSVMLPLEFLSRFLVPALGSGVQFDRTKLELSLGAGDSDVLGIEYRNTDVGTEVRLHLARSLRYRAQSTSQEIVRVQLAGAKLDPLALADDQPAALVRNVRAEQGDKDAAIYFQVDPTISGLQDHSEDDGKTILLTLIRGQARPEPHAAFVRPLVEMPDIGAGADSFDLVVIDPGHGGFDHGVQAGGRTEKDVVLRLAQQLQPLLERELGVRVLLARNGDETMTPEGRAEIANRLRADVFLSLHCNGWYDAAAHGFEVLYAVPERSPAADAASASASRGLADFSPWQAGQTPIAARSAVLADALQAELERQTDIASRGSRPAEIEVLSGATMPAVLLEVGFLTDPEEAAKLEAADFPAKLAAGLAAGIRQFEGLRAAPDSTRAKSGDDRD